MAYVVYVDLSAKAEQLSMGSAVAVSNGKSWVYLIPSQAKQQVQQWLAEQHGTRNMQYRLLALFVYVAVRERLPEIRQIVIDRDYTGGQVESTIKSLLLRLIRRDKPDVTGGFVQFENVKGSRADRLAREVFQGKAEPQRVISLSELERALQGNK